jgi:RNA polymerase sigma-54 factor
MKQNFQLRLGQQLTMTPQLQQAIRLLQLSTFDLQVEIQQALESNIMLEMAEDEDFDLDNQDNLTLETSQQLDHQEADDDMSATSSESSEEIDDFEEGSDDVTLDNITDIPEELTIDSDWEDVYGSNLSQSDYLNGSENNGKDILANHGNTVTSLHEYLYWQLELTPFSRVDNLIATALIDAIDSDGYLRSSLDDIILSLGTTKGVNGCVANNEGVGIREVEAVLHRIQHFDPLGVGSRDLSECLLIQLAALTPNTRWLEEAKILVTNYLSILGGHDYTQLAKRMKLNREELREVIELIQSLNPRPGAQMETSQSCYIIPDVFVNKFKGQWKVELNQEIVPNLRINSYYANLISGVVNNADSIRLKNHLQEAKWFLKSLKSRHETLLKVASCIVKRQEGFLEYGEEAMKPLVLHDIARELNMHESTISRVTTQKYLHTPRGIFELKYFFSSHVNTDSGGECSSTAIRALIKKLIAEEDTEKPLSDSKIATLLSERGIKVARRTVAKYREAMVIPSSNERKRLI